MREGFEDAKGLYLSEVAGWRARVRWDIPNRGRQGDHPVLVVGERGESRHWLAT